MAHILHLPVFPEGSPINPDAINCFIMDEQSSDSVAHLILNTEDTNLALQWTMEFLDTNPHIPQDEVTLTKAEIIIGLGAYNLFPFESNAKVSILFKERYTVPQKVVELPIYF